MSVVGILDRAKGSLRLGRALKLVWDSAPRWTVASLVLVLAQGALPVAGLVLLKLIIDAVGKGLLASDPMLAFGHIVVLVALAGVVALLGIVLQTVAGYVREMQGLLVTEHVYGILHAKSVELDLEYYENPTYQDTLHRTQQEATSRPVLVLNTLLGVAGSGVTLVGILALLASLHWLLVCALVLAALPAAWSKVRFANRTYHWMRRRAASERQAGYLTGLLVSPWFAKDIRMWGLGPVLIERFRSVRAMLRAERLRISRNRGAADIAAQAIATVALLGALAFLARQALIGALTLGALVMYYQAIQKGQGLFADTLGGIGGLYEHNLFLAHLDEFLRLEARVKAPTLPHTVPTAVRSGVVFEDVSFRYPTGERDALRHVSLSVGRGEMVALVGPNGCGKTTLIKLLCRLYDPVAGRIMLDGVDLRRFDPVELRRQVAVLFQDYALYAFSAKENVWFGRVDHELNAARVVEAAREAGIDEVIRRFPKGYDSTLLNLFEGGQALSGGESQKIALARTFYSNAQLLILDEPSSGLDAEAEFKLFEQIRSNATDCAAIVISHRFSTVRKADRIYVLREGAIVEGGTHEELMRLGGTYARLFELQASQYRPIVRGEHGATGGGPQKIVPRLDPVLVEHGPMALVEESP